MTHTNVCCVSVIITWVLKTRCIHVIPTLEAPYSGPLRSVLNFDVRSKLGYSFLEAGGKMDEDFLENSAFGECG